MVRERNWFHRLKKKISTDETCLVFIAHKFEISVNACYTTCHVFKVENVYQTVKLQALCNWDRHGLK